MADVRTYFTGLASVYAEHRPTYPDDAIRCVLDGLPHPPEVADIGCGTGISARLLAKHGARVIGIDPNRDMLTEAQRSTDSSRAVKYRTGTGEDTGLEDASLDLVACAQSFHWFDAPQALKEFHRVLRPAGRVALMWNWKLTGKEGDASNEFSVAFTQLMVEAQADASKRGLQVPSEREADPTIGGHFKNVRQMRFPNPQSLDQQTMLGRAHSASYYPKSGPVRDRLNRSLIDAFNAYQINGRVTLLHMTEVTLADRA